VEVLVVEVLVGAEVFGVVEAAAVGAVFASSLVFVAAGVPFVGLPEQRMELARFDESEAAFALPLPPINGQHLANKWAEA